MLEPTTPGFTDVVWDARQPEQLARDLVTGAGAIPAAEAGVAWGRLSAGFAAAAIEYERILENLGTAWESKNSSAFIERIRALRDWFTSSAAAAASNALQAESHAAAYELARLAMPDAGDVEKIRDLQRTLEQLGTALGAPILSKAAGVDADADAAKAVAARVMRTYEAATEPLSTPWEAQAPPPITEGMATSVVETAAPATEEAVPAPGSLGGMSGFPIGPISIAPIKTEFRVSGNPQVTTTTEKVVAQPVTVQTSGSVPMAPAAMAGSNQSEEEHVPAAGLAGASPSDEELGLNSGMQVAPAVLGGIDASAQRAPVDIAFNAGSTGAEVAAPATATREEVST
ncbi:PPE domain-containing protein [Nocardia jejuensis]|uniref:PPE domain-containing protein n=1 Tax=Nocardia jejuensis TaxID=328049 RepID=UPI0008317A28|nr:PPE domain-containing protein [Nocardia jejuensis]